MQADPFAQFKAAQREGWALFVPLRAYTTPAAARLVEFAPVQRGRRVLDVGCGTGVVAVTAARRRAGQGAGPFAGVVGARTLERRHGGSED